MTVSNIKNMDTLDKAHDLLSMIGNNRHTLKDLKEGLLLLQGGEQAYASTIKGFVLARLDNPLAIKAYEAEISILEEQLEADEERLLRFVKEGRVARVGGAGETAAGLGLIAATSEKIMAEFIKVIDAGCDRDKTPRMGLIMAMDECVARDEYGLTDREIHSIKSSNISFHEGNPGVLFLYRKGGER